MEGNYLNFPSKKFCLTVPKHFVEEAFFAVYQKNAGNEKVYGKEMGRGEYQKFPSKNFCLKLPKQMVGEPLTLISFGYRKCFCFRGLCHNFPSKFFCLTVPKHFVEKPFCDVYQKNSGSEKVYG